MKGLRRSAFIITIFFLFLQQVVGHNIIQVKAQKTSPVLQDKEEWSNFQERLKIMLLKQQVQRMM